MNIYFLINSLTGGGAERQSVMIGSRIKPKGFILLEKKISYKLNDTALHILSNLPAGLNRTLKYLYIPLYVIKLKRMISKDTVIISFLERANFVNILTKLLTGHKSIVNVTTNLSRSYSHGLKRFNLLLIKLLYPLADVIIANSKGVETDLSNILGIIPSRIAAIYNPIDLQFILNRAEERIEKQYEGIFKYPVIITAGRLVEPKGHWYLIRIFNEILKSEPSVKLVILGEGELDGLLIELCNALGLRVYCRWLDNSEPSEDCNVFFLGFKENPFKYFKSSAVFTLTSLWEGFPNALIEALVCKLPVIASDCNSGPREILSLNEKSYERKLAPEFADFGVLMPPFDGQIYSAEAELTKEELLWVNTIKTLLKSQEMRDKLTAKALESAQRFSIDKIIAQWLIEINRLSP
ncbi:glycosyltransferase [Candidatus Magnetoovum chiemensis]|nr:glycosyltransferase [Candidatus Magnetoovum chiemensis]